MSKALTPALDAYFKGFASSAEQRFYACNLYTITLQAGSSAGIATGQILSLTDLNAPVLWNGLAYLSNSIMISGLKYKSSVGIDIDKQQIAFIADASHVIGGVPFLQAVHQGVLDGAEIQRERAFFANFNGAPPLVPIGTVLLFKGRVTKIDVVGRTKAKASVESDPTLLKIQMPRNFYSPSCIWLLYGSGCRLPRSGFTFNGAVEAGSTQSSINWAGAAEQFQQGSITFTSGRNVGLTAYIKTAASGVLTIGYPLLYAPAVGDAFSAVWGCDHTLATCNARFSNVQNFRGHPYLPPPQIITGPLATTADASKG